MYVGVMRTSSYNRYADSRYALVHKRGQDIAVPPQLCSIAVYKPQSSYTIALAYAWN
jgi:hypothetical protein